MTQFEKDKIVQLRQQGYSFADIAYRLDLNAATVRSYCSRNNIEPALCPQCGSPVMQTPHRKHKRFCCTKCRMIWWNHHAHLGNRNPHHTQECPVCQKTFDCFKSKARVYCSRKCYAEARRKAVSIDG